MKMSFLHKLLIGICVFTFIPATQTYAQMDSLLFHEDYAIDRSGKGELTFSLDNVNFIRDNEYDGRLTKGYTLPGLWIQPTFGYQPLRNLRVEAGVYLLRYWGANKYPNLNYSDIAEWKGGQTQTGFHCLPVFRVQLALSNTFDIILGTLYGKNNHNLIDPLYNKEMGLTGDPEAGIQLLWKTRPMDFDMWVNWESFIFQDDDHQESFTFGLSTRFKANNSAARTNVYFPVQMLFQHRGGEINPDAESRSVKTWLNAAAGVGLDIHLRNRIFTKLNLEATAAYFGQQKGEMLPFDKGYGVYAKATADIWRFQVHVGYWQCKDFITVFGNPLFGTVSTFEKGLTYNKPKLVTASVEYSQSLAKGFSWGIHADVLNNLAVDAHSTTNGWYREGNAMSFAVGLYLRVNPSFLIKRF